MSIPSPSSALPQLADSTLRWSGPALVIRTDAWQKQLCDKGVDEVQRQALKQAVRDLQPAALIVDLSGVEMLPAICSSVLAQLAKGMDAIRRPGRMAIVGAMPSVLDYLRIIHFDRLYDLQPSEAAAMERIKKELDESPTVNDESRQTKFFSFTHRGGICIVAVKPGLFDQMPEMEADAPGPSYAELREEFCAGLPTLKQSVLLDLRAAGEFNHRTLNLVAQLCQIIKRGGGRIAVCGLPEIVPLWQLCKFDHLASFFTSPADALLRLQSQD